MLGLVKALGVVAHEGGGGFGSVGRVEVRKVGGTLTLSVNDVVVGSIDNLPIKTGSVGMILVCGSDQAEVAYDDFVLTELVP